MSLKPVKKSDQNKSWMQPRRDRRKMIHTLVEKLKPYLTAEK